MTTALRRVVLLACLLAAALVSGCATLAVWEREHLADPIMSFEDHAREAARELHWIEAREGSTGGTGVSGGGCACN